MTDEKRLGSSRLADGRTVSPECRSSVAEPVAWAEEVVVGRDGKPTIRGEPLAATSGA